jgi:3-hydroxyisobutyrate dehydrogenase
MLTVGFIGLGTMGAGMAGRLIEGGFPLSVYNRNPDRAASLVARGARLAASPRDAAQGADIVMAMVADDQASRQVWVGERGALEGMREDAIGIDSSTLSPAWVMELAEKAGRPMLDAPVTGSRVQAAAGQLLFLVGGEAGVLERARPALRVMSRDIVHLGPAGSGARMKLVNNFLCGVHAASIAEAIGFIERSGLDREKALAILTNGAPGSPMVKSLADRMAARDYGIYFALHLMDKDLRYAAAEARSHGVTLRTAEAAEDLFREACDQGWGDRDLSAVVEAVRGRENGTA